MHTQTHASNTIQSHTRAYKYTRTHCARTHTHTNTHTNTKQTLSYMCERE